MTKLINVMMEKFKKLDLFGVGVFKICLISFGVLLGTSKHDLFKKVKPLVFGTFLCSYILLMYEFILNTDN